MTGNPLNDPTLSIMYDNALQSLYAGNVMPFERQILALAPLPDDVVDPYAAQDVDPNRIMQLTYQSLSAWIDEAKKANYLSKHFTDLSKLILKGVNTMGRGLMTLHDRGEDLSQAPMQIGDLISVASYHFRKSYLGVMQTAASQPEISERLLLNQLSWTNMLLRLYKTKDKLEKPVSTRELPAGKFNGNTENGKLPDGDFEKSKFPALRSSVENTSAFSDSSGNPFSGAEALLEPAAISAPRALSSFDSRKQAAPHTIETKCPDHSLPKAENRSSAVQKQTRKKDPEKADITGPRNRTPETGIKKEENTPDLEENNKNEEITENRNEMSPDDEEKKMEEDVLAPVEAPDDPPPSGSFPDDDFPPEAYPEDDPFSETDDDLPPYLNILQNVFARGQDPEHGTIDFTEEEMRTLAADPGFNRFYPETAAEFRSILEAYDST